MNGDNTASVVRRFAFHDQMPGWMYVILSTPIIIGLAMLLFGKGIPLIAPLWCMALPLFGLTDRERAIDKENGVIINRWKLYGRLLLWQKSEPISNFVAITCRRASNSRSTRSTVEQEWIALVRPLGKFSYVQYFSAIKKEICPQAQAAARKLTEATGLPIRDYPDRLFNRRAPVAA